MAMDRHGLMAGLPEGEWTTTHFVTTGRVYVRRRGVTYDLMLPGREPLLDVSYRYVYNEVCFDPDCGWWEWDVSPMSEGTDPFPVPRVSQARVTCDAEVGRGRPASGEDGPTSR